MSIKHRYYLELQIWDIQDCYMKKDSGWSANADTMTNDLETELQFIRNNIDWESEWITEQKSTDEEITMFYPVYDPSTDQDSNDGSSIVIGKNVYVNCSKDKAEQYPDMIGILENSFDKIHFLKKA